MPILNLMSSGLICTSITVFVLTGGGLATVDHYAVITAIASGMIAMSIACFYISSLLDSVDKTSPCTSLVVDRYIICIWILMSTALSIRYFVSVSVGTFPARLDVGGHWAGFPVGLSETLQAWCWWTVGLSIIFITARFNRSMVVTVGYFLIVLIICQLILGAVAFLSKHTVIMGIATRDNVNYFSGTFINRNNFAYFIATAMPFSLSCTYARSKSYIVPTTIVAFLVVGVCFASMVWSQSRLGTVSTLVSTTVWLWFYLRAEQLKLKKILLSMFAVCILISLVVLAAEPDMLIKRFQKLGSTDVRFDMLKAVFEVPISSWCFGIGVGNLALVLHQFLPPNMSPNYIQYLHNDYLQFAIEFGLVVTFLFFFLIAVCMFRALRIKTNLIRTGAGCGMLGTLIGALFDFPLHVPGVSFLFCFLCGVIFNQNLSRHQTFTQQKSG